MKNIAKNGEQNSKAAIFRQYLKGGYHSKTIVQDTVMGYRW